MKRIVVFAGTNEGRVLCEFLAKKNVDVTAIVATKYASEVMPEISCLKVITGRLSVEEISRLIDDYDFIVDATHPYAKLISDNIKLSCIEKNKKILRIVRPNLEYENVIEFIDIDSACKYLKDTSGNILVTTGSKELIPYTTLEDFKNRIYLRVLPTVDALNACLNLGFSATNLICMQGPFSQKVNEAMMEQVNAKFIVTKESGRSGGLEEKLLAANKLGIKVVLIGRPYKEEGISLLDAQSFFEKELGLIENSFSHFPMFFNLEKKKIIVVGGGNIATRRIKMLIKFGVCLKVVAPKFSQELDEMHNENKLKIIKRNYKSNDLKGAFMVIAATNSRKVNEKIFLDAKESGVFVNVVDKKEQCDFYFPSIFEDDQIIGGLISRQGKNHRILKEKANFIRKCLKNGR